MTNTLNLNNNDYIYLCDYNQLINSNIEELFIQHRGNANIITQEVPINEEILKNRIKKLPQLIFEVSANCNLRCKYCIYNNNYLNQRELTPLNMSFETAKKGMDYLYSIIKDRKDKSLSLSFYGGEPMLNFKLIQDIFEYGKILFVGWNLFYNMTSNLTLLNDSILEFIVKNNIAVMVSLDGDKENHNSKRVFINGNGTFDTVIKNLEKIKTYNEDYFKRKISFSTVFSFDLSLQKLSHFFNTYELIKSMRMRFSAVSTFDTTYYDVYPFKKDEFQMDFKEVFLQIKEKILKQEELSGFEASVFNSFKQIGDALNGRAYNTLGGSCLFDSRLYIDAEGRFHACEKINNKFPFGNVETGFDYDKMITIINDYIRTVKEVCSNCNLKFLCTKCFASFCGDGEFKINPDFCKSQRQMIVSNLESYIKCKEEKIV